MMYKACTLLQLRTFCLLLFQFQRAIADPIRDPDYYSPSYGPLRTLMHCCKLRCLFTVGSGILQSDSQR